MQIKFWGERFIDGNSRVGVFCPGFLGHKDQLMWESLGKKFEENQMGSVAWTPSGYGEEKDNLAIMYQTGQWRVDLDCLVEQLEQEKKIRKEQLVLVGHSMGGMTAMHFAAENNVNGLVAIGCPGRVNLEDKDNPILKGWRENELKFFRTKFGELGVPYDFLNKAQQFGILDCCPKITTPTLFIVGEKDEIVKPSQAMEVYGRCSGPKELMMVRNMEHTYTNQPKITEEVNTAIVDFVTTRELVYAGN